jgi:hypothetical protein
LEVMKLKEYFRGVAVKLLLEFEHASMVIEDRNWIEEKLWNCQWLQSLWAAPPIYQTASQPFVILSLRTRSNLEKLVKYCQTLINNEAALHE